MCLLSHSLLFFQVWARSGKPITGPRPGIALLKGQREERRKVEITTAYLGRHEVRKTAIRRGSGSARRSAPTGQLHPIRRLRSIPALISNPANALVGSGTAVQVSVELFRVK